VPEGVNGKFAAVLDYKVEPFDVAVKHTTFTIR